MLSPEYFRKAGIFDFDSVSNLLQKIEKTGNSSEVDDMVLVSVISTHLIYNQFIERFSGKPPEQDIKQPENNR